MATASVPYSFVPLEDILSSEANANFAALVAFLNSEVVHKDGTVASTGTLSGPAADPVSDNQYARKAYVDKLGLAAPPQVLTSSSAPISVDGLTDFALNNVQVYQDYWYALTLHSQAQLSDVGTWNVDLRVNGVTVDHFFTVGTWGTASHNYEATCYWKAPATAATDDFTVFADETSGAGSLTFTASASVKRTFTIVSLGQGI